MATGSDKKQLRLFTVDAFAAQAFAGNPAAVCLLDFDTDVDDVTLQNIAVEMNRTAGFVRPLNAKDDHKTARRLGLRWFTVAKELNLCGHATLASAAVLFYKLGNPHQTVTFCTLSGDLTVSRDGEYLTMDFPVGLTQQKKQADYTELIAALGDEPGVEEVRLCSALSYLMVRLKDGWNRQQFESWRPDIARLERSVRGVLVVVVTTRGSGQQGYVDQAGTPYTFVSRCFAPWINIPEDPVTGSAQTILAQYWSQQLEQTEFYTRQCSSRGGEVRLRLEGDRVKMSGQATIVLDATLHL
ncbi:phenazine biosynthesis-like domain-containing protein 1 [Littorina saxatilis]|uniref:Phenazine biosynthesis-like protein n=1 Tax=Littorina saxatilis TaxID=31220 RepID=A0AAN9BNM5_9CAEN